MKDQNSLLLEDLLKEGFELSQKIKSFYQSLGIINSKLITIVENSNPYRRKTVKLNSGNYAAIILFKDERLYAPDVIPMIKTLLGETRFNKLFREKSEYKSNFQSLRSFMATKALNSIDAEVKDLINKAEIIITSPPYIKFSNLKETGVKNDTP